MEGIYKKKKIKNSLKEYVLGIEYMYMWKFNICINEN